MAATLILTQGAMARELLATARKIVGEMPRFAALCLEWDETPESAREKIERALTELNSSGGTLILTDLFGGTPYNVACTLRRPGEVEVLSGVNLPMVVRLGCAVNASHPSLSDLSAWIQEKGRASIRSAGDPGPGSGTKGRAAAEPERGSRG